MALYEVCLTGNPTTAQLNDVKGAVEVCLASQGKVLGVDVEWHVLPASFNPPERSASTVLFFGGTSHSTASVDIARAKGIPIIPIVSKLVNVSAEIPPSLTSLNCLSYQVSGCQRVATATLESLGLLPKQRRVFVSYRRTESRDVAVQLFDELSAKLFDVFLDTHGVAPGDEFQDVLWHRLCDCDVLIMLDTATYFNSRWTAIEFGRALAKGISILRVGWPGIAASPRAATASSIGLAASDFEASGLLKSGAIDDITQRVEAARSLGHAVRTLNMYSKIETSTVQIGGSVRGAGLYDSVEITLPSGVDALVIPAIGVPSASTLQSAEDVSGGAPVAVVYDQVGLLPAWEKHLQWLGGHVKSVRWIKASEIAWELANWVVT
jgi:hypothetical protein